jgi:hypothetical protein
MARQSPLGQSGTDLMPSRYTEQRTPQFVGGQLDPTSGNLQASSADLAARGQAVQGQGSQLADLLEPRQSTTRLAAVSAMPMEPAPQGVQNTASTPAQAVSSYGNFVNQMGNGISRTLNKWF